MHLGRLVCSAQWPWPNIRAMDCDGANRRWIDVPSAEVQPTPPRIRRLSFTRLFTLSTSNLPSTAFLPQRPLGDKERHAFVTRRDRLFALCSPAEQRRLIRAAHWYDARDPQLLSKPNIFGKSHEAVIRHKYLLLLRSQPPGLLTRILARVASVISLVEHWRGQRVRKSFLAHLSIQRGAGAADELIGVVHFLRLLPVEVGFEKVEKQLEALAADCAADTRVPVVRRFAAAARCKLWPTDVTGTLVPRDLSVHVWRLLLELADEDAGAAGREIDEHWERRTSSELLNTLYLDDEPQLAYRLAVKLRPHRADFAVSVLSSSIWYSSFQLSRVPPSAVGALQQVMDASCLLLAEWTLSTQSPGVQAALGALTCLFQFGDPQQPYWRKLAPQCLALCRTLPPSEQARQLRLLASVVLYTDAGDPVSVQALELVLAVAHYMTSEASEWFARPEAFAWDLFLPSLETSVSEICRATVALLEDKTLSGRNRRVEARPDHALLHAVDDLLGNLMERAAGVAPQHALLNMVSVIRGLSHQGLVREHHRRLRQEFERRARAFPADAGLALKRLIQYCGFSQVDDEMYKKDLCQESFDLLLPVLEAISPEHAAVARTGIGWSPRGHM